MKCVVVINDPERERGLVDLGSGLAPGADLLIVSVIEVPEGEPLASAQPEAKRRRRELSQLVPQSSGARTHVTVGRQGWTAVVELSGVSLPAAAGGPGDGRDRSSASEQLSAIRRAMRIRRQSSSP